MSALKKAAVALLFLLSFLFAGYNTDRQFRVEIIIDGRVVLSRSYEENPDNLNVFQKLFGFDYGRRAEKLKEKGYSDAEAVGGMFLGLSTDISALSEKYSVKAVDASVKFTPQKKTKFEYAAEADGRKLNTDKLYADLCCGLSAGYARVSAEFYIVKPDVTAERLRACTVKKSGFETYYGYSADNRKKNVELAASLINGLVIKPNEVFSFNQVVGARTAARGFKEAPMIVDGKFTGGVGGGVCQVSSTLYNAVLYADLAVKSVARHSLPVKYVSASFDAMVSSATDFRFENNTQSDIYIEAYCKGGCICFCIYGAPNEYKIKLESKRTEVIARPVKYVDDEDLPVGEEKIIAHGADGLKSCGYVVKYKDGSEVRRVCVRKDTYMPQEQVVARGTKIDVSAETPAI